LVDDLLEAFDRDPAATFRAVTDATDAHEPPCPRIDRIDPDRGPPETRVRLEGAHFDAVHDVRMYFGSPDTPDDRLLSPTTVTPTEIVLDLVNPPDSRVVCIALYTEPDWYADGAVFVFELPDEETPEESAEPDIRAACPPVS
jgi:hypothetical protein